MTGVRNPVPGLPLTDQDTFDVEIETASGSCYRVTWDAEGGNGALTRTPAPDRDAHPMSVNLRRDQETVTLLGFDLIDVGHRTTYVIDVRGDGIATHRWANPAVAIRGTAWGPTPSDSTQNQTTVVPTPEQVALMTADFELAAGDLVAVANGILRGVHRPSACSGQPWGCWIHHPFPHRLDHAPVRWREDNETAERVCDHGIGHPDPQDAAYWWNAHNRDVTVHGCDGCCLPLPTWTADFLPSR